MNNPFDPSKDVNDSPIVNALKYNMRNSFIQKERIKEFIKYSMDVEPGDKIIDIIDCAMRQLGIPTDELTVADEHELIDWVYEVYG